MRKHALTVAAIMLVVTGTGSGQQPTFPTRVDLVTVDVLVHDRQGIPVEGLRAEDFTIREDGARQKGAAYEARAADVFPVDAHAATPAGLDQHAAARRGGAMVLHRLR